ncbi:hypothetical protein CPB83DRAFT_907296 [Crepidotus variabilis]|uniref:Uncharacterized protein n=1 Tax=Crepidotus variabilis TaxID=179855 RepID=A0A9P6EFR9_9AGAR|nr:hypothetical protein CPB83DRAFT_907296 [Crepidotus variabilis]
MRFTTVFSSVVIALFTVSGVSASCRTDMDCGRGKMCKFRGVKDSRGECYKRNEGPPTPRIKRSFEFDDIEERGFDDFEEEFYARYFDDEFDL